MSFVREARPEIIESARTVAHAAIRKYLAPFGIASPIVLPLWDRGPHPMGAKPVLRAARISLVYVAGSLQRTVTITDIEKLPSEGVAEEYRRCAVAKWNDPNFTNDGTTALNHAAATPSPCTVESSNVSETDLLVACAAAENTLGLPGLFTDTQLGAACEAVEAELAVATAFGIR